MAFWIAKALKLTLSTITSTKSKRKALSPSVAKAFITMAKRTACIAPWARRWAILEKEPELQRRDTSKPLASTRLQTAIPAP